MEPFQSMENGILVIDKWQQELPGLVAGFTTRNGGKSKVPFKSMNLGLHVYDEESTVLENREILAKLINVPTSNWVSGEQVHGTNIAVISSSDKGKGAKNMADAIKNVDGLLSNDTSLLATAFYADCVPLFFIDPVTKWFGVAHAGWKGTVGKIGEKMVQFMCEKGSDISNIKAVIGPSISSSYYEVDQQVIDQIPAKWHSNVIKPTTDNKYQLDLKKLNQVILLDSGLKEDNIEISTYCTYKDSEMFFSHRRDQGKTGRMFGFIGFSDQLVEK